MKYILGFKPLSPLVRQVKPFVEEAALRFDLEKQPVKMFTETLYRAKSWRRARRVITKVEYNALGSDTRFIITNLEHWNRRFIYQTGYSGRGAMELMIKEHKNHLRFLAVFESVFLVFYNL